MAAETVPSPRWRPAPRAAWTRAEDGVAVVMDLEAGTPLRLSPAGSAVWEALLGGLTPDDDLAAAGPRAERAVVADVAAAYDVDPAVVADDVAAFLALLAGHGAAVRDGTRR